jgi:cold shock CspA family protein
MAEQEGKRLELLKRLLPSFSRERVRSEQSGLKGFGFIASDRGGKDIFVHATALERAGIAGLMEGQRVAVDVIDGRKGPEAAGLRLI